MLPHNVERHWLGSVHGAVVPLTLSAGLSAAPALVTLAWNVPTRLNARPLSGAVRFRGVALTVDGPGLQLASVRSGSIYLLHEPGIPVVEPGMVWRFDEHESDFYTHPDHSWWFEVAVINMGAAPLRVRGFCFGDAYAP
jgi:hypothetical protein